jgi:hypothetical protein
MPWVAVRKARSRLGPRGFDASQASLRKGQKSVGENGRFRMSARRIGSETRLSGQKLGTRACCFLSSVSLGFRLCGVWCVYGWRWDTHTACRACVAEGGAEPGQTGALRRKATSGREGGLAGKGSSGECDFQCSVPFPWIEDSPRSVPSQPPCRGWKPPRISTLGGSSGSARSADMPRARWVSWPASPRRKRSAVRCDRCLPGDPTVRRRDTPSPRARGVGRAARFLRPCCRNVNDADGAQA